MILACGAEVKICASKNRITAPIKNFKIDDGWRGCAIVDMWIVPTWGGLSYSLK